MCGSIFKLEPIFNTSPSASKFDPWDKNSQKWLKNKYLNPSNKLYHFLNFRKIFIESSQIHISCQKFDILIEWHWIRFFAHVSKKRKSQFLFCFLFFPLEKSQCLFFVLSSYHRHISSQHFCRGKKFKHWYIKSSQRPKGGFAFFGLHFSVKLCLGGSSFTVNQLPK
jgi:hypothetical protein